MESTLYPLRCFLFHVKTTCSAMDYTLPCIFLAAAHRATASDRIMYCLT